MNNEQKAELYNQLLFEFGKLGNEIASIKGENIDLNESQLNRIKSIQIRQNQLMIKIKQLMS